MYWENGRQSFEGNFVDDQINGKETWWYESGQIKSEKYYEGSLLDGKYTEWYENGQIALVEHYENGQKVKKTKIEQERAHSSTTKINWNNEENRLNKSAENGGAEAQFVLAWQYYDERGVKQSNLKAAHWWLKAAQQGHPKAQTELANLIYLRDGDYANTPSVDLEEALFWLNKAAKQGYWDAKGILNALYEEGFIQKSGDSFIVVSN